MFLSLLALVLMAVLHRLPISSSPPRRASCSSCRSGTASPWGATSVFVSRATWSMSRFRATPSSTAHIFCRSPPTSKYDFGGSPVPIPRRLSFCLTIEAIGVFLVCISPCSSCADRWCFIRTVNIYFRRRFTFYARLVLCGSAF